MPDLKGVRVQVCDVVVGQVELLELGQVPEGLGLEGLQLVVAQVNLPQVGQFGQGSRRQRHEVVVIQVQNLHLWRWVMKVL